MFVRNCFSIDLFGNCYSGASRNLARRLVLLDSGLRRNDDFDSFRTSLMFTLWSIFVFIVGCGQNLPDDLPKLYPTQIEITADGEKLAGAVVTLYPVGSGEAAGAVTDDKGIAHINTRGHYAGAAAGKYKVCVNWAVTVDGPTSKKPAPTDPAALKQYESQIERERHATPALEQKFRDTKATPLEIEVVEGKNSFSVEVELSEEGRKFKAESGGP